MSIRPYITDCEQELLVSILSNQEYHGNRTALNLLEKLIVRTSDNRQASRSVTNTLDALGIAGDVFVVPAAPKQDKPEVITKANFYSMDDSAINAMFDI